MNFNSLKISDRLLKAITDLKFEKLTPIQEKAIPYLIDKNEDLIALAQTGTGKTAAFGIPIVHKIDCDKKYPQAIILSPTRELCLQISKDLIAYSKYFENINITAIYGGSNIQPQIKSIRSGTQIVVGTPGRVKDLINRKVLKLKTIEIVVLDEADEMLNMGFKEDLDAILSETPSSKQTLLFSATMPNEVMKLSKTYMHKFKTIEVASRNEGAKNVDHHYYMVNAKDRYNALRRICDINPKIYGIIFCRTRRDTKNVADKLMNDGYNADALHGDLSQSQRDHVMSKFRNRNIQLLVATDVAARGIDIDNLTHVINYNLPDENEVYVHRSGRTGRAGRKGISIIIAHSREGRKINAIEKMIKQKIVAKNVPTGKDICKIQLMHLIDNIINTEINTEIDQYIPEIENKFKKIKKNDLIKQLLSVEFNRLLSFYKNAKDLDTSKKEKKRKQINSEKTGIAEKGYSRFYINLGKETGIATHNLIGLINERTRNRNIPVGKIDIMKKFSFFEIPNEFKNEILNGFKNYKWNDKKVNVEISKVPKKQSSIKFADRKNKRRKKLGEKSSFKNKYKAFKK